MEEWKDINGYEGYYQVSNHGRVRSLDREIPHARYGSVKRKGRVIAPGSTPSGYVVYGLKREGKTKGFSAHALVLEHFLGERPEGMQCCHNDGDKKNNHISNLRWGTDKENKADIIKHGRNHNLNKEVCAKGHLLDGKNLSVLRRDSKDREHMSRGCVTCGRARAIARYHVELKPHLDHVMDFYYERVWSEGKVTLEDIKSYLRSLS